MDSLTAGFAQGDRGISAQLRQLPVKIVVDISGKLGYFANIRKEPSPSQRDDAATRHPPPAIEWYQENDIEFDDV